MLNVADKALVCDFDALDAPFWENSREDKYIFYLNDVSLDAFTVTTLLAEVS